MVEPDATVAPVTAVLLPGVGVPTVAGYRRDDGTMVEAALR